MADGDSVHGHANFGGVNVEQSFQVEVVKVVFFVAWVVGKRLSEPAHADDDHVPVAVQSEDALQFAAQRQDGVTHAARAETSEVREVFAHLKGADLGFFGELIRTGAVDPRFLEVGENAKVSDQSGDGRGGDAEFCFLGLCHNFIVL